MQPEVLGPETLPELDPLQRLEQAELRIANAIAGLSRCRMRLAQGDVSIDERAVDSVEASVREFCIVTAGLLLITDTEARK